MSGWIIIPPVLNEFKELLCPPLFEQSHQLTPDGFHLRSWDFGNSSISVDVACSQLLEFEISSDVGMDQHLCELAIGHEEFRDQVYGIVSISTHVGRDWLAWLELFP